MGVRTSSRAAEAALHTAIERGSDYLHTCTLQPARNERSSDIGGRGVPSDIWASRSIDEPAIHSQICVLRLDARLAR
ncbi:unnamed protein product [Nippostrongylus brasiliensis]|uniref:Uncharacterized protein n=1 Tax=Nippostrongylus brasiliensis TaxID=27835 RepID=A0A0N4Y5Z6_NIPBR|nr:unnamed protein product [Nippostrongylus brasiliensis]